MILTIGNVVFEFFFCCGILIVSDEFWCITEVDYGVQNYARISNEKSCSVGGGLCQIDISELLLVNFKLLLIGHSS